jgi:hypothetical protein
MYWLAGKEDIKCLLINGDAYAQKARLLHCRLQSPNNNVAFGVRRFPLHYLWLSGYSWLKSPFANSPKYATFARMLHRQRL